MEGQRRAQILRQAGIDPAEVLEVAALSLGEAPVTMYRVDDNSGRSLLLKLVEHCRRESSLRAETIASWLAGQGVNVPAPLPGFPRATREGNLAILLPFMNGKRVEPTIPDMGALGQALGVFHQRLGEHPDRSSWRDFTNTRVRELEEVRGRLAEKQGARSHHAEALAELAADQSLDFRFDAHPRRLLHGDLNPGNILMVEERAVLLDFEDVFHSVLPIAFDLAMIVERLILVRVAEEGRALDLGRVFMNEYRRNGGYFSDVEALSAMEWTSILRSLALRALCILALGERHGIAVGAQEWEKFFSLEQLAKKKAYLLEHMTREIEIL